MDVGLTPPTSARCPSCSPVWFWLRCRPHKPWKLLGESTPPKRSPLQVNWTQEDFHHRTETQTIKDQSSCFVSVNIISHRASSSTLQPLLTEGFAHELDKLSSRPEGGTSLRLLVTSQTSEKTVADALKSKPSQQIWTSSERFVIRPGPSGVLSQRRPPISESSLGTETSSRHFGDFLDKSSQTVAAR